MNESAHNGADPKITFTWTPSSGLPTIDPTVRLVSLKEQRKYAGLTIFGWATTLLIAIGVLLLWPDRPMLAPNWRWWTILEYILMVLPAICLFGIIAGIIKLLTYKRSKAYNTMLPKCLECGETSNITWSSVQFDCLKCGHVQSLDVSEKYLGKIISEGLQCVMADCRSSISLADRVVRHSCPSCGNTLELGELRALLKLAGSDKTSE